MRTVTIEKSVETAVRPSQRVLQTAAMFGLGVDESRSLSIVKRSEIPLPAAAVIFITGPSGGGKSTILNLIAEQCISRAIPVQRFDDLPPLPDLPLVDIFDHPGMDLAGAGSLLALVGLSDAFVMLRTPSQLSDGQRYRLRIAQTIDFAQRGEEPSESHFIFADEFGATLDRQTARNLAAAIRRWTRKTNHTFICATTHHDLLEPLEPDVLIYKPLGEDIEVLTR